MQQRQQNRVPQVSLSQRMEVLATQVARIVSSSSKAPLFDEERVLHGLKNDTLCVGVLELTLRLHSWRTF